MVVKEEGDAFSVVNASDCLGKDGRNVICPELADLAELVVLGNARRDDNLIEKTILEILGLAGKDPVRNDGIDTRRAVLLEHLGRTDDRLGRIHNVIDDDRLL